MENTKEASESSDNPHNGQSIASAMDIPQQGAPTAAGEPNLTSLASFLSVDGEKLAGLENQLKESLVDFFNNFQSLKSEKMVWEMKFEQLQHSCSKKSETLRNELTDSSKMVELLTEQVQKMEKGQTVLEEEISNLKSARTRLLQTCDEKDERLASVCKEKQNAVELLTRRQKDVSSLDDQLKELSNSNKTLRAQLLESEKATQESSNEKMQLNFTVSRLEQEVSLYQKNQKWYESEVSNKLDELQVLRREKRECIAKLESDLERSKNDYTILKSQNSEVNRRFEQVSKQLQESLLNSKSLSDKTSFDKEEFVREMRGKDRIIESLQETHKAISEREKQAQNLYTKLKESDLEVKKSLAKKDSRINELEATLDQLTSVNHPLSASATETARQGGMSLSELYTEFQSIKMQLVSERRIKEKMQLQVDQFVEELTRKIPLIEATKRKCAVLEKDLNQMSLKLETTTKDKNRLSRDLQNAERLTVSLNEKSELLNQEKRDLKSQVMELLVQLSLKCNGEPPLSEEEKTELKESETDSIISARLVKFKDLKQLIDRNQELLKTTRSLARKLDNDIEKQALEEAKQAILSLEEEINQLRSRPEMPAPVLERKQVPDQNNEIKVLWEEKSKVSVELATTKSSLELAEQRANSVTEHMEYLKRENSLLLEKSADSKLVVSSLENKNRELSDNLVHATTHLEKLKVELSNLEAQKSVWASIEQRVKRENAALSEEKSKLFSAVENFQKMGSEREEMLQRSNARLEASVTTLEGELASLNQKLEQSSADIKGLYASRDSDSRAFQNRLDRLLEENKAVRESRDALSRSVELLTKDLESAKAKLKLVTVPAEMEAEFEHLRKDLTQALNDVEQFRTLGSAAEKQLEESRDRVSDLELQKKEWDEMEGQFKLQVEGLSHQCKLQDQRIHELEGFEERVKNLENQLNEERAVCSDLRKDIDLKSKQMEQQRVDNLDFTRKRSKLESEISSLKEQLKLAEQSLSTKESSWEVLRLKLEEDRSTLQTSLEDAQLQNRLVLNRLEEQVSKSSDYVSLSPSEEFSQVIVLLRREKDVLESKCHNVMAERDGLQQRLELVQKELDSLRLELAKSRTGADQEDLTERLKELDNLKKQNDALVSQRDELSQNLEKLSKEVKTSNEKITLLESQCDILKAEVESKEQMVSLSGKEIQSWKERADSILQNYDRVDPQELATVKKQLEDSQTLHSRLKVKFDQLRNQAQGRIDNLRKEIENLKQQLEVSEKKSDKSEESQVDNLNKQIDTLTKQLESKEVDLDAMKKEWETAYQPVVEKRISNALEDLKKRIRLPSEEKIQSIANKRVEARVKELEEEFKKKQAELGSSKEVDELKKEYEKKIQEASEKGREMGRAAAKKENDLRTKLLIAKAEKTQKELEVLKGGLKSEPSEPSEPPKEEKVSQTPQPTPQPLENVSQETETKPSVVPVEEVKVSNQTSESVKDEASENQAPLEAPMKAPEETSQIAEVNNTEEAHQSPEPKPSSEVPQPTEDVAMDDVSEQPSLHVDDSEKQVDNVPEESSQSQSVEQAPSEVASEAPEVVETPQAGDQPSETPHGPLDAPANVSEETPIEPPVEAPQQKVPESEEKGTPEPEAPKEAPSEVSQPLQESNAPPQASPAPAEEIEDQELFPRKEELTKEDDLIAQTPTPQPEPIFQEEHSQQEEHSPQQKENKRPAEDDLDIPEKRPKTE